MFKKSFLLSLSFVFFTSLFAQETSTPSASLFLEAVEIKALRTHANSPFAKTLLNKKYLENHYFAQDFPYVLQNTPSFIAYSDAGNGIGQTSFRIRGSDASRINITINGVPFNDAESQGVFIGNVPDITSSSGSIQIQRGVGSSTNGGSTFGGSINISTNDYNEKFSVFYSGTYGSFNSVRNSLKIASGLLGKHFTMDLRLSQIHSDNYIRRADANYLALYYALAYWQKKYNIKLNYFVGQTFNYQAWNGVSKEDLHTDRRQNTIGLKPSGKAPYNAKDNYLQHNFQLIFNDSISKNLLLTNTVFSVIGAGFYDNYNENTALSKYNITQPNITNADFINQKWLHNVFFGNLFTLNFKTSHHTIDVGLNAQYYKGRHFGLIPSFTKVPITYYNYYANKADFNGFIKWETALSKNVHSFLDLQLRYVRYKIDGDENTPTLNILSSFFFTNPKIGLSYTAGKYKGFFSFGIGNREPSRNDLVGNEGNVKAEKLYDVEIGNGFISRHIQYQSTLYLMFYTNQLTLTGSINDVGSFLRSNVGKSFRAGIENELTLQLPYHTTLNINSTFSQNKILTSENKIGQTISFSPDWTNQYNLSYAFLKYYTIQFIGRYISRQFLNNAQNANLSLPAYYLQDIHLSYTYSFSKIIKSIQFTLTLNNLFNTLYEPNGYVYDNNPYFYPAAGFNASGKINILFQK